MAMPALTRAQSEAVTPAQLDACERMSAAAERRALRVFGPSSFVVPEADPGTPAFCVSSQRRNGAWHLVWVQTVDGVPRLMCSCPARRSERVFTCSHAQAVRLHLAAQCAVRASRPASYVESVASPSGEAPFLGTSWAHLSRGEWHGIGHPYQPAPALEVPASVPAVPADAVESLAAWSTALDAAGPLPLPADLGAPEPDEPDPDDPDDDDPDPTPPPAAAALPVEPEAEAEPEAEPEAEAEAEAEPEPEPARIVHCPRCGRAADVDALVEHGACARCIHARPELSQSLRRTPDEKAEIRRRIIAAEEQRQCRYKQTGRADDWRRGEEARERDAKRRERRESDEAEREASILYRDNRGISPWRS